MGCFPVTTVTEVTFTVEGDESLHGEGTATGGDPSGDGGGGSIVG